MGAIEENMNSDYIEMWDNWSSKREGKPVYDLWLDEYKSILEENKNNEILDLGSGIGANTLYLIERGYKVLSCDFSNNALKNIEKYISDTKTKCFNMISNFPIEDNSYNLIIADLSLHYFNNETTIHIMKEIKRILKKDGILLARVASINDINYGAIGGEELEKKYYFVEGYNKRFFDINDINKYFGIIGKLKAKETSMTRNEEVYVKPKVLYQVMVEK